MGTVFGIRLSPLDKEVLTALITTEPMPPGSGVRLVVTANVDHIVNLTRNQRFRKAYSGAWLATADGMPVALYATLRRCEIPGRVTGADLFTSLMLALSNELHRPFFVVSKPETGACLRTWLLNRGFSTSSICTEAPPFGFEYDNVYSEELSRRIREHGTTHLFLGVGSPKSEIWVDQYRLQIGDCYAFGFGAGLDYFAGTKRRAPHWVQTIGFEWIWRIICEPRRLSWRYIRGFVGFVLAVKGDLLH